MINKLTVNCGYTLAELMYTHELLLSNRDLDQHFAIAVQWGIVDRNKVERFDDCFCEDFASKVEELGYTVKC